MSISDQLTPPNDAVSKHIVALAIGSNVGDRYANIENALREMERRHEVIKITGTSFLYESQPMYVEDQDKFLNCAIMAETTLQPTELLILLKRIEDIIGRVKSSRNGPRAIDLDIIFYDTVIFDNRKDGGDGSNEGELVIPHARLCEREFVLRPLNDIMPDYIHPFLGTTVSALFNALPSANQPTLQKVLPFPSPRHRDITSTLWPLSLKTYLMATINATPDSFSSAPNTTASAVDEALAAAADGADIIDVGGYSTRPGATAVSPEEELKRVVPVVRKIRDNGIKIPISVDTFRPTVLRAAVDAGANCLNDVTALTGDQGDAPAEMALMAREFGIPIVMMHSRGAHRAGEDKEYGESGVLVGVQQELGKNVNYALRSGVRRWNVLVDPGFGFSKTTGGNLGLLSRFRELTAPSSDRLHPNPLEGFPTLAGLSRKSFLGNLLGRKADPQDRNWATAAAVTAAVQQGADVMRVHKVRDTRDVLRVADAVWRKARR
ncbi:Dihydropteroate synthase-like protein [Gautieria morchelliformis]|nr:Dihydropteroate synthase-like protein [Gautieria morchelliformis]